MLVGNSIYLRPLTVADAKTNLQLQQSNREFFEQFAITRNDDFYTLEEQIKLIERRIKTRKADEEYYYGIFTNENDTLIGSIHLFQVFRGPSQSAFIGYFLNKDHNGKGYMTEAVKLLVDYGFNELKLHRIEAGVMPHNIPSIRVLEKAGFHQEGLARKNVNINGKWEDHQVLAIINPND
ncbi:MAG: GNAT family N-acetyltransferase [Bacillaceae bacterium]